MQQFSYIHRIQKVSFQFSGSATKTVLGDVDIITQITHLTFFSKPCYSTTTSPTKVTYCSKAVTHSASLSFYCVTELLQVFSLAFLFDWDISLASNLANMYTGYLHFMQKVDFMPLSSLLI